MAASQLGSRDGSAALPQLTRHGLSVHADLVYRCLRLQGGQTDSALARALGLSPQQVSAALEELEDCGAVEQLARRRRREWTALAPEAFAPRLRARRARLALARQRLTRSLSIVDIAGATLDGLGQARPMANPALARRRYLERVAAARSEFLAMNPEAAFSSAAARTGVPASRSALFNGAHTRSLGVPAADEDESNAYAGELFAYGMEYRESPRQPVKFAVLDRKVAYFPIDPSKNFQSGVWEIHSPSIVDDLAAFFLRQWAAAAPPAAGERSPRDLSDRERAVLAALALGDTDEMAAKRLRLSSRTIRYVVSDLMERYQVKSRFQLGLVLGRTTKGGTR